MVRKQRLGSNTRQVLWYMRRRKQAKMASPDRGTSTDSRLIFPSYLTPPALGYATRSRFIMHAERVFRGERVEGTSDRTSRPRSSGHPHLHVQAYFSPLKLCFPLFPFRGAQ